MFKHPFILLLVAFSVIGILIATQQVSIPQIFKPKANVVGVTLSLVPSEISLAVGQEVSFDLALDSANSQVTGIEMKLVFDSANIIVTDIVPTDILPQTLGKDLTKAGEADIILLTSPGASKEGKIAAKIRVKALKTGNASLKFDPSTKVSAEGKTGDVLGAVESAQITVTGTENSTPVTTSQMDSFPISNQADEAIQEYLNSTSSAQEATPPASLIGKYQNLASEYFKDLINTINTSVEKQARKFLD